MTEKRIVLDQDDFEKLTGGKIISKDGVKIALSDIGFHQMIDLIRRNWNLTSD